MQKSNTTAERTGEALTGAINANEVRKQLRKILNSDGFLASDRRRQMLHFVIEETLEGRSQDVKAVTIAMAVFGRDSDFDQQSDPVVRLEARKLRSELDAYYANEGRDDSLRVTIPKGRYVPHFDQLVLPSSPREPVPYEQKPSSAQNSKKMPLRWIIFVSTVGLCALALLLVYKTHSTLSALNSEAPGNSAHRGATVMVERFTAPGGDDQAQLIGAALTHDISAKLLRFPDLKIHLSPATYGTASAETDKRIQFLVTGEVQVSNGELMVKSSMLDLAENQLIWSDRFIDDLNSKSIMELEHSMSDAIATVLGQEYGAIDAAFDSNLAKRNVDPNLDSFACVASAHLYRRSLEPGDYRAVRACLETSVKRDPEYAMAWAMLGFLRLDGARFGHDSSANRETGLLKAREVALRAIALDPQNYEAYKALSHIEQIRGNAGEAIAFARKAVELNPHAPDALAHLALRLAYEGKLDEALPLIEDAIERSVAPIPFYFHVPALYHLVKGDWHAMHAAASRALVDGSALSSSLMAIALGGLGRPDDAASHVAAAGKKWPLLTQAPEKALAEQNVDEQLVSAFVEGLTQAGWVRP